MAIKNPKIPTKFVAYEEPGDWLAVEDGDYSRWQVFSPQHPASVLSSHIPRYDERYQGVRVEGNVVVGVMMRDDEAIARAASAVDEPVQAEATVAPLTYQALRVKCKEANLPSTGTLSELRDRLGLT
jgi:hypothetical protein